MHHPMRSAIDLFRSRWWSIGWGVAAVAFGLHAAALALAPLSVAQAVLAGGFVLLAVLAERFFGFKLGRRQWLGVGLVALALAALALTGTGGGGARSEYSYTGMIIFEAVALGVGLALVYSHATHRRGAQKGVLLGIAAGLGFGISDIAIKALSDDLSSGLAGVLSPWTALILAAAVGSFFASARSLQIGEAVTVIALTSVAANVSTILAGVVVFGDSMGNSPVAVVARTAAFVLVLVGAALMPAPVRAGDALEEESVAEAKSATETKSATEAGRLAGSPA